MARFPGARWRPLPENSTQARIRPTQVIVHSAVDAKGPTSLWGYFSRRDVTVESHFWVTRDGKVEQYLDTEVRADCNRRANVRAISIETEDDGSPDTTPWTDAQIEAILGIVRWAHEAHGIPLRVCPSWDAPGVGYHSMFGAPGPWTPARGKTCPGRIRIRQFRDVIVPAFLLPTMSLEGPMNDQTAQGLVILTYLAALGRKPESLQAISQGGEAIKRDGLVQYVGSVTNSPEGTSWLKRLRSAVLGSS